MRYPMLRQIPSQRQVTDEFRGYNHNLRIGAGEFYEMKNMTSDFYPILAPRGNRGTFATAEKPTGLVSKDTLCWCDGREFVMDGYRIDLGLSDEPKQLVSMGAYVIILPDRKYINTADLSDFGSVDAVVQTESPVSFSLCKADGSGYENQTVGPEEPEEPENGQLWLDTSTEPHSLKQWSETNGMWVSIATTYIRIGCAGIGTHFERYDGIEITGLKDQELIDSATGEKVGDPGQLQALEGAAAIWAKGDDYIVVVGILDASRTIKNSVTISRTMPEMDFVVEAGNRLWGCRYGLNREGKPVNEIYCSKLGDFKNWKCYMGLANDSWYGQVGSDGAFTGAVTHLGYPCFFKETTLHKVYISEIGAHGIQDTACRGVQRGSGRSLAIVGETLFYKSRQGVCAYDGALPVEVSAAFGGALYSDAVAGAVGNKYYLSQKDTTGKNHLFVYDAGRGMWHREDDFRATCFCRCRDELYAIEEGTGKIRAMRGSVSPDRGKVSWMAETAPVTMETPDQKYISRITLRLSLELGSRVRISIQYDSMGQWENLCNLSGVQLRSYSLPIRLRRCDHFRLRIEGEGECRIYSMAKTLEGGGEIT